jgi:hypothetical protein
MFNMSSAGPSCAIPRREASGAADQGMSVTRPRPPSAQPKPRDAILPTRAASHKPWALNKRSIPTASGRGEWDATKVRRVLARLAE